RELGVRVDVLILPFQFGKQVVGRGGQGALGNEFTGICCHDSLLADKYTLRVPRPVVTNGRPNGHQNGYPYTSDPSIVASPPGWPSARGSPPPLTHRRASTRWRSTPRPRP